MIAIVSVKSVDGAFQKTSLVSFLPAAPGLRARVLVDQDSPIAHVRSQVSCQRRSNDYIIIEQHHRDVPRRQSELGSECSPEPGLDLLDLTALRAPLP